MDESMFRAPKIQHKSCITEEVNSANQTICIYEGLIHKFNTCLDNYVAYVLNKLASHLHVKFDACVKSQRCASNSW
jgi:hypothetical protein